MTSSSTTTTTNEIKQQFNKVLEQVAGTSEDRNGMIDASIKNILAGVLGVNLGANGEQIIAKIREKLTTNDDDDEDNEDGDEKIIPFTIYKDFINHNSFSYNCWCCEILP